MDREYTGNAYVFLSDIAPLSAAIRSVNIMHRGLDGLVEWRGGPAQRGPLLTFAFAVDGEPVALPELRLERLDGWVPRFSGALAPDLRFSLTLCAPAGYEALARGALARVDLENRGSTARMVELTTNGTWAWTVHCVGSTRPLRGGNRLIAGPRGGGFALETGEGSAGAALAVVAAAPGSIAFGRDAAALTPAQVGDEIEAPNGEPLHFALVQNVTVPQRRRGTLTIAIAAGLERDGALYTGVRLAAQDGARIIQDARIEATRIARRTAPRPIMDMVRRNLLFAANAGAARAIDDDRLYPVASRILEHGPCAVVDELDVLLGVVPALIGADPFLARELLLRMFELYSDRAGTHLRYVSGGVLAPGFSLSRFSAYSEALDGYVRDAADPSLADEILIQDILREMDDWLWGRLHRDIFLCATDLGPRGDPPEYPFSTIDNVRVWRFCRSLAKYWQPREGEPPPRFRDAADEIAAAIWQHCTVQHDGGAVFAGSVDLEGNAAIYDDPEGSLRLLPALEFCDADDPVLANTMELLHSAQYPLWRNGRVAEGLAARDSNGMASFGALCADLLTTRRERALQILASLSLHGGIACRAYDPETGEVAEGAWSAARAGLLAWALLRETAPKKPEPRKARR